MRNFNVLMDQAPTDGGAPASGGAAPGAPAPWYQGVAGVDSEIIGHITNTGWDKKSAAEAAVEAVKSWKAAEKHIGVPADRLLRLPENAADEQGWNAVWSKLGQPTEAKGYDFSTVKYADGTAPDEQFLERMRNAAFKMHVPKEAAAELTREVVKYLEHEDTNETAEKQAALAQQKANLKKNWGQNEAANMFVAQRAAQALGIDPATVAQLEGVIGYDKIMEMFRSIGSRIGEDKFITGAQGGNAGPMTREQAVAQVSELKADKVWVTAYLNGDSEKRRQMNALTSIITGIPIPA